MQRFFLIFFIPIVIWGCNNGCNSLDCKNTATCYEGQCLCAKWYSGEECQLQYNRNYEGTYVGTYSEADRSQVESLEIKADGSVPNRLVLPTGVYLDFLDEENLTVPRQQVIADTDTLTIKGEGTYSNEVLQFRYSNEVSGDELVSFQGSRTY